MEKKGFSSDIFKNFQFSSSNKLDLATTIQGCLEVIQKEVPDITNADNIIPPIVVSALASVGAWHYGLNRDQILHSGSVSWPSLDDSRGRKIPLIHFWTRETSIKSLPCIPDIIQYKWSPSMNPSEKIKTLAKLDLTTIRDGPSEVWSRESVTPQSSRRIILSYVQDKLKEPGLQRDAERKRGVVLDPVEAELVSKPSFFDCVQSRDLEDLWHDGMKYRSPDGLWNSYAGVVPYMLPGSAVWHLVPRIRLDSKYPTTGILVHDNIIASFAKIRAAGTPLNGLEDIEILPAKDKPFRDLSGVRRLWPMGEATCGMLRDDLIISIQDMAGIALTFMHYDNLFNELASVVLNIDATSRIERKRKIPFFSRNVKVPWADLCKNGESARLILEQTLIGANCDSKDIGTFCAAALEFWTEMNLLVFWYALMTAKGHITSISNLRHEVLEDLALAPAFDKDDIPKVYFMIEAAIINRLERQIPYEESIKRFLKGGMGGKLLLQSIDLRAERIDMEMTRSQLAKIYAHNKQASWRQPGWKASDGAMKSSWIQGERGLCYLGRFTTSASKPLYIDAASKWADHSQEHIVKIATEGKSRMVVLLTDRHRLYRKFDDGSKTEIIVCSIFYMDEEEHNQALSNFGKDHFHAEERIFRGRAMRWDAKGRAVEWYNSRKAFCAVNRNGSVFELRSVPRLYQIVVTSKAGAANDHLAAIRIACCGEKREPVAVSYMDILEHVSGESGDQLWMMRPDQISPDGVNIVDYSFEYESFWADTDGRTRCTVTADEDDADLLVDRVISSLREREWWGKKREEDTKCSN